MHMNNKYNTLMSQDLQLPDSYPAIKFGFLVNT